MNYIKIEKSRQQTYYLCALSWSFNLTGNVKIRTSRDNVFEITYVCMHHQYWFSIFNNQTKSIKFKITVWFKPESSTKILVWNMFAEVLLCFIYSWFSISFNHRAIDKKYKLNVRIQNWDLLTVYYSVLFCSSIL